MTKNKRNPSGAIITKVITQRSTITDFYFKDVSKLKLISNEEEVKLFKRIAEGDKSAIPILLKANLRFVISIAKEFQGSKIPLPDLINEGNIGLIKAVKRFDVTRGFKFITYAVGWIRQSIRESITNDSNNVRIPTNRILSIRKVTNTQEILEQRLEREPTIYEIAEYLDCEYSEVSDAIRYKKTSTSFDEPFYGSDTDTLLCLIPDQNCLDSDDILIKNSLRTDINHILEFLPERNKQIIQMYYGIGTRKEMGSMMIEDIAEVLGLTKERIRQLKDESLIKLKRFSLKKNMYEYYA